VGYAVRAVRGDTRTQRESAGGSSGGPSSGRRRAVAAHSGEGVRVTGRPVLKRRKTARAQLSSATTSPRILGYLSRSALVAERVEHALEPGLTNRRGDRPTVVVDKPFHFHHSHVAKSSLTGAVAVPAASVPWSMPVRDSLLERGGATRRAVEELS
jgi:hypothetical protein